jgi:hypothetical protein
VRDNGDMPLPAVLREGLRPLPRPRPAVASEAARARPVELRSYDREQQEQDQWCWAAIARSIAKFYDRKTRWVNQCVIANHALGRQDCCSTESPNGCNEPFYLDRVLKLTGNFRRDEVGAKTLEEIADDIENGRPIACRIEWRGGGSHFVVISGCDVSRGTVTVDDPWSGESVVSHEVLCTSYQGLGGWTQYFETQSLPDTPDKRRTLRA